MQKVPTATHNIQNEHIARLKQPALNVRRLRWVAHSAECAGETLGLGDVVLKPDKVSGRCEALDSRPDFRVLGPQEKLHDFVELVQLGKSVSVPPMG